jgi:hypothetical protein
MSRLDTAPSKKGHHWERDHVSITGFHSFLEETVRDVFESQGIHIPHRGHRQSSHGDYGDEEPRGVESTPDGRVNNRSLPLSTLIEMLKEQTGKDYIDVGSIRMTQFHLSVMTPTPKSRSS